MKKDNYENSSNQNIDIDQSSIMNRVNQTYDKIAQDVRNMIEEKDQNKDSLS